MLSCIPCIPKNISGSHAEEASRLKACIIMNTKPIGLHADETLAVKQFLHVCVTQTIGSLISYFALWCCFVRAYAYTL